jgi:hypothetical protein
MNPNFLGKAKEDGAVFMRIVGLVTKISKIKIEMTRKKRQRETHLRTIGVTLHDLYHSGNKTLADAPIMDRVAESLDELRNIEHELKDGEEQIARLRAEFKQHSGGKEPPDEEPKEEAPKKK